MFIKAYAKLNLALGITGKLPDGYHALDMVMQTIGLYDEICIKKASGIHLECESTPIEVQNNTAYRAAELFFEYTKIKSGVQIRLEKHIPAQAGLGGGSSDGAAVLRGLNELYQTGLNTSELEQLALKIGADAPFFIRGGCARAQGIGEKLAPIQNRLDVSYLLAKPDAGVNTKEAYQLYARLGKTDVDTPSVQHALENGDLAGYAQFAENALYPAAVQLCPQVEELLHQYREKGARFALMSGSGSCVFALYEKTTQLQRAAAYFKSNYPFVAIAENTDCGSEIVSA